MLLLRNLKTEVSLWKCHASNVFRPYYAVGKRRFRSENASNVFRPQYAAGKRRFRSENTSNVFRPHYAVGKRRFRSENASKVFLPHYTERNLKTQQSSAILHLCLSKTLGQGNIMIICTLLFSKSSVFKMFSVHTKTQSLRFQIPPVWRSFSKSSVFVTD